MADEIEFLLWRRLIETRSDEHRAIAARSLSRLAKRQGRSPEILAMVAQVRTVVDAYAEATPRVPAHGIDPAKRRRLRRPC